VENGLRVYEAVSSEVSNDRNPLALYIPYSDFIVERWNNYFLPALDAFRGMGIAIDILPYAPPLNESIYPYYPFHMNEDVLRRLLAERTVLVLANVSGFQQTDSDLIKAFVEAGGVVVAFGPQIPYGRSYERRDLFGGDRSPVGFHTSITARGTRAQFRRSELFSWRSTTASVIARYEDGSAAIVKNRFGKGVVFAILPDATFASENAPRLVRAVLDEALVTGAKSPLLEISGTNRNFDIAVRRASADLAAAIVNHDPSTRVVAVNITRAPRQCSTQIGSGRPVSLSAIKGNRLEITIPKTEVAILRCKFAAAR
jgi:hypothetical protein